MYACVKARIMSLSMPNDEFSLVNVLDKLRDAGFSAADWKELGRRLKPPVPEPALRAIEANSSKVEHCLEKVIDHWQRNGEDPSWETLAQAVAQCREGGGQNVAVNLLRTVGRAIDSDGSSSVQAPCSPTCFQSPFIGDALPDAKSVFEEIKEASKCSFLLGVKLELPQKERREIVQLKGDPEGRLLRTIEVYLKRVEAEPKMFWKGIVEALRGAKLTKLAKEIVKKDHESLKNNFAELFHTICSTIISMGQSVSSIVRIFALSITGNTQIEEFNMKYADHLCKSESIDALFVRLSPHWDYMHPEIYVSFIQYLPLTDDLKSQAEAYQRQLEGYLDRTLLTDFCNIQSIVVEKPPPTFVEMATNHQWDTQKIYLRDVENFRREFASECRLQRCAVLIKKVVIGSVVITMFVPESTELSAALNQDFLRKFCIVHMVFNGRLVYSKVQQSSRASLALHFALKTVVKKPMQRLVDSFKTQSPLTKAAEKGTLKEVLDLIANGADSNPHTISTPLKEACSRGDIEIARALLEAGADPNLVTDDWTPLMEASRVGNRDMIQLLMEFGTDPNTVNSEKWTALMAASNNGRTDAVIQLLQDGADPNMQDHVGWSALLSAVNKGHERISLRLVEAGANPHLQNMEFLSAIRLSIMNEQENIVIAFLDRHPDCKTGFRGPPELDWPDKYDETDLLFACKKNYLRVVKLLLRKGANPNTININGESPLLAAIDNKNVEMVEDLLKSKADPNNKAEFADQLPLYHARQLGNNEIVRVLKLYGAEVSLEHELPRRETPLQISKKGVNFGTNK